MKKYNPYIAILFLIITAISASYAGNTGKITGKITDAMSGEPVIGANVSVMGTPRGAVTDFDGKYTIIGVPIGNYSVKASHVNYASVEVKDVKVGADETTPLNFKMTSTEYQLGGITITADQQLVNNLTTSSTQTVGEKSIASIPNVKSVEDVLKLKAGFVKQGNNLFLRGGRANEVQYLVDGIPTNNIVSNSGELVATKANVQLAQLYAGVNSGVIGGGASGLAVSANAIQSVSVQTSGFDADYGNAQSGIINITTKSGSEKYTGSIQFRTDKIKENNQNESYSAFSFGGPEPITKYLLPGFGFQIPGALTFFISADVNRNDGPYQYVHNEFYNPVERRVELNGFLGGVLNGLGFRFRDNQRNSFTFNSKLKYDISGNDQVSFGYRASIGSRHDYIRAWKYRADSSSIGASLSIQNNLSWQHFFNERSFMKVYFAKLENHDGNDIAGITPAMYSSAWENLDINNDYFNDLGTSQRWYKSLTTIWSFRFDLNTQIHPLHMLKTGFEVNYEEIQSTEIVYPTVPHSIGDRYIIPPVTPQDDPEGRYQRGLYPGYGSYRWYMNQYPSRGGWYLQDNIELSGLNLHVGIRYDYLDIGRQVYDQKFIDMWRMQYDWRDSIEGRPNPDWVYDLEYGNQVNEQNGKTIVGRIHEGRGLDDGARFWYYLTHGYFSPRLSIGYPVTDRIVFYFNYGHFLQFPDRDQYYRDPFLPDKDAWIGNPSLKPQRTVAYEAGFEDQFTDDMAFSIHAFYKDIFDYATPVSRGDYSIFKNLDYASTRGFELTLNQAFAGNFSTAVSYSYQIAKGRSSNPLAAIFQREFQLPRETRLDWDQNHTANIFTTYRVGPQEEGTFGIPYLNNYGVSLTWNFGTGFPYNGFNGGRTTARNVYLINSETTPYTTTLNLSMYKGIQLFNKINLLLTFDVTNLLDRRNPVKPAIYSLTKQVYRYGDIDPDTPTGGVMLPWFKAENRLLDRSNFEAPRQVILGLKLNWD
ncbi:MAG: TonB-dependent receptor [Ignavibacteriales bacterium]|nr:TonB-dependent receptor [Ignavibacteriales bacterium]